MLIQKSCREMVKHLREQEAKDDAAASRKRAKQRQELAKGQSLSPQSFRQWGRAVGKGGMG